VRNGQVLRKNRWRREPDYTRSHQVRIERFKPRPGYRHFISPPDLHAFLGLLPDFRELAIGLQRVVLSADASCLGWHTPGTVAVCAWEEHCSLILEPDFYAEHADILQRLGVPCRRIVMVKASRLGELYPPWLDCAVCAKLVSEGNGWYRLHGDSDVVCERCGYEPWVLPWACVAQEEYGHAPGYLAEFNETTVQAFLLVHVLLHELGHHHDRMTSPRQRNTTRGERYAEEYARRYEKRIWSAYRQVFKLG
jgi:hypothetical protein